MEDSKIFQWKEKNKLQWFNLLLVFVYICLEISEGKAGNDSVQPFISWEITAFKIMPQPFLYGWGVNWGFLFFSLFLQELQEDLHSVHCVAGNLNGNCTFQSSEVLWLPWEAQSRWQPVHYLNQSAVGFCMTTADLQAGRVLRKVFHMLYIFKDSVESTGGELAKHGPFCMQ